MDKVDKCPKVRHIRGCSNMGEYNPSTSNNLGSSIIMGIVPEMSTLSTTGPNSEDSRNNPAKTE